MVALKLSLLKLKFDFNNMEIGLINRNSKYYVIWNTLFI